MLLKWKNGCAGTGVTLPIFARGTWMETYVKVNGRWAYLYRAVDSRGRTVDFYLSSRRNSKAAYRFLGKSQQREEVADRDSSTRISAPMVARLLCFQNAKAGARLTLNTDRLSTGNNVIEYDHNGWETDNRRHAGDLNP